MRLFEYAFEASGDLNLIRHPFPLASACRMSLACAGDVQHDSAVRRVDRGCQLPVFGLDFMNLNLGIVEQGLLQI